METRQDNRGGRREGAGRKPMFGKKKVPLCMRVSPQALLELKELCKKKGVAMGTLIESNINNLV